MKPIAMAAALIASSALLHAKGAVLLHNEFVEQLRNRVTIEADFLIDAAHPHRFAGDQLRPGRRDSEG